MRVIVALMFGLIGAAILVGLGVWQVQRLHWKDGVIAQIATRIDAAPIPLPAAPEEATDNFLPVTLSGSFVGAPLRVLGAWRVAGTGFRIVAPLQMPDGRRVMVDLGVIPLDTANDDAPVPLPEGPVEIAGNLNWPDDLNAGTPASDGDTWFARDVDAMADVLVTERAMVVARNVVPPASPVPVPVGVEGIPNNHFGYAVQWFGLAAVWLGMTGYLVWRIRRRTL